jgi:hypothetical protein
MEQKIKGQAAIEFLVTYGWAILAAMLVIAALSYFGITNPATSLPDKCLFSNAFECNDYIITSSTASVRLVNILGQGIYSNLPDNISAILTDTGAACTVSANGVPNPTYLDPEAIMEVTCNNPPGAPFDKGDKARIKMTITYSKNPSGYDQVSLGEVYATVQ